MSIRQRVALTLPDPRGVNATIEMARRAESEGYDDLWFADSGGVDALTTAAAVAIALRRMTQAAVDCAAAVVDVGCAVEAAAAAGQKKLPPCRRKQPG